ncbi:MAG TPA: hypothetical protein VG324_21865 [Blastocatellia bacterium]|nr:hypothetical protein [Blastocatellia bacterium]
MKRKLTRLLIIVCLLAAGGPNSFAQEKNPRPDESRPQKPGQIEFKAPPDGTFKLLGPKFAIGKVVKGAPYSATATTETIQTLSDGNQIIRKNESKLYRDSEGRTRTEQTLETIGKWTAGGEAPQHIFINDPVAGVSYNLDPRTRTAHKNIIPQKKAPTGAQAETLMINGQKVTTYTINGKTVTQAEFEAFATEKKKRDAQEKFLEGRKWKAPADDNELIINGQKVTRAEFEAAMEKKLKAMEEQLARPRKEAPNDVDLKREIQILRSGRPDITEGQKKTESLGAQTIEGVTAEGTRRTLTIPAGEIGNTLPIECVEETWYSPELQITVMSKFRDPRTGETTYRLTNLSRSEPDRSLFEVPPDYTFREGKMPAKGKPTKPEE